MNGANLEPSQKASLWSSGLLPQPGWQRALGRDIVSGDSFEDRECRLVSGLRVVPKQGNVHFIGPVSPMPYCSARLCRFRRSRRLTPTIGSG
jgi:hypothetical protein